MKAHPSDIMEETFRDSVLGGSTQQFHEQVDRLLQSASFRDTPSSRRLLEYIAARSLEGNQNNLKEFTIGVEVLGRRADFDPKTDTIVRVQVRRLRQKINQYYVTEGVNDPIIIAIPKGSYAAEFSRRGTGSLVENPAEDDNPTSDAVSFSDSLRSLNDEAISPHWADRTSLPGEPFARYRRSTVVLISAVAVVIGCLSGYWLAQRQRLSAPTPVEQLWSAMLKGDDSPIIGYPDAVFLLDGASNMFQFAEGPVGIRGERVDPNIARKFTLNPMLIADAGPLYYENGGYTGTGEIESMAMLSVLLNKLGFHPKVLRSHDITVDDLRNHNVILLGGSAQNTAVKDFLTPGDFEYNYSPRAWGGMIMNHHPKVDEASVYQVERNPLTHALEGDYALISCLPGVNSSRHIITIGGLDTTGTLGATLFLTSEMGAKNLMSDSGTIHQTPYFQSIVHVHLTHGNQVFKVEPVALHKR
jgi:hypothetical protein